MIELFFFPTPNGHKILICLEELKMDYRVKVVDITQGDQFRPEFIEVSPNNRIPAIVDHAPARGGAPLSLFESGAILLHLAEKAGQLMPEDPARRAAALSWLFWQVAGLGPNAGNSNHFGYYAKEKHPYPIKRFWNETNRLYGVLNKRLADRAFVADEYSIADIATYPWIRGHETQQQNLDDFPHVKRWFLEIRERPAVVRAYEAGKVMKHPDSLSDTARQHLHFHTSQTVDAAIRNAEERNP